MPRRESGRPEGTFVFGGGGGAPLPYRLQAQPAVEDAAGGATAGGGQSAPEYERLMQLSKEELIERLIAAECRAAESGVTPASAKGELQSIADGAAAAITDTGEFRLVCEPGEEGVACSCRGLDAIEREQRVIERAKLLSVLRREDTLRHCAPVQELYDRYALPPPEIEAELQRVALAEHGLCRCWLPAYWQTAHRYPCGSDAEVRSATVWLRVFERTRRGVVGLGERVPPVALLDLDSGQPTSLLPPPTEPPPRQRPMVAIAGSGS
jgi:hypothetical protein